MAGRGQPKKIKSGKQLIDLWTSFCEYIRDTEYTIAPTQTDFCRWLSKEFDSCDRRTIYNALNKYFPTIKGEFERIQADTITSGAMLGRYNSTMSIFALKNWCKWTDKQEVTTANIDDQTRNEVNSLVESINDYEADENESD